MPSSNKKCIKNNSLRASIFMNEGYLEVSFPYLLDHIRRLPKRCSNLFLRSCLQTVIEIYLRALEWTFSDNFK